MTEQIVNSVTSFKGEMLIKGMPFGYFDHTGHISIWNVITLLRGCINTFYKSGYIDFGRLTEGKAAYSVLLNLTTTEEFYDRTALFKPGFLLCTSSLRSLGKSSLIDSVMVSDEETGKVLLQGMSKLVLVDKETEKPAPLPDWFVQKYAPILKSRVNIIPPMLGVVKPDHVFEHKVITQHSEIDHNGHVGTQHYFRFCMEAAMEASASGFYRKFNSDISMFPVLNTEAVFMKACKQGEELAVSTWQGQNETQTIYFVIKKGGEYIMKSTFVFGENEMEPIFAEL